MTTHNDHDLLVTSGVGPRESRRFVHQLAVHLEALAERCDLAVIDVVRSASTDDDDAPRSVTLRLRGDADVLAGECGTHVLVHKSPARSRFSRKRWFAAVTLHAAPAEPTVLVELPRDDLVITACRAGGPGGQHVNKVATAVRVEHVPSGLAIRCAAGRSQKANLDQALRRLAGLLRTRDADRVAEAGAARRDAHYRLERGRAIRTYRLDDDGLLVPA
ncbi:MAG: peptide chain release factor-like protein [Kofleriaceae bacterium]